MIQQLYNKYVLHPLKSDKSPSSKSWTEFTPTNKVPFEQLKEQVGFSCGFYGIEVIDIDNHFDDADDLFEIIYNSYDLTRFPIVKTRNGGYHVYFASNEPQQSQKLALRPVIENDVSKHEIETINGKEHHYVWISARNKVQVRLVDGNWQGQSTLIETKGVGGYVVCPPSPDYDIIQGDLLDIPRLTSQERMSLLVTCRALNEIEPKETKRVTTPSTTDKPGDIYNSDMSSFEATKTILRNNGWKSHDDKHWSRPGKELKDGISATFGKVGDKKFYVFSSNADPFEMNTSYSMFAVKTLLEFNGDYSACAKSMMPDKPVSQPKQKVKKEDKNEEECFEYVRIGDNYYKNIYSYDQKGNQVRRLVRRQRQSLLDDFGKDFLETVKKFDDFCNVPNHVDYKPTHGNCYNMYHSTKSKPSTSMGSFETIRGFMTHIFEEHLEMGYDYIQLLWTNPTQILPVLCLVSEENQTGKTTFGNFLNAIFGHNFVTIGQNELTTEFNGSYASKLIAMVDESWISYKVIDKLKFMATSPSIMLRQMNKDHMPIDFFCKFILCSNRVDDFIIANENDERYWVRKIKKFGKFDPDFLAKLIKEIPYFLHFLSNRELSVPNESRAYFAPARLRTKAFEDLVRHSKDVLIKEIVETLLITMERDELNSIDCTCKDLKDAYFDRRNDITLTKIKEALQKELKIKPIETPQRYHFGTTGSKIGRYYTIDIDVLKRISDVNYKKIFEEKIDFTPRPDEYLF